ncbi:hypothetical protein [Amnibacterium sp.]|uniref:hypothetical protein n=1 Tax=Amnibacterium sp. TaxID=1872496 RepID=UPI002611F567|nr:hypothetical protein [Amnibacterium sp.]MCU1473227.1 hypothetical protein [Amnibacterium sp.]
MRISTTRGAIAALSAGLVVAALAGCAEASSSTPAASKTASSSSAAPAPAATPTPVAEIPSLSGVHTQVTLDAGFLKALTSLKLTPGVVGTATLSKAGVLSFPITGGHVTYYDPTKSYRPYVQGEVDHMGSGISLSAGGKKVELTNFVIDPGNNSHLSGDVSLNGTSVAKGANLFRLDGSTLKPLFKDADGNAVLEGTTVYVSDDAAALLDKTFGTTAVTGKLEVGIAKITAK